MLLLLRDQQVLIETTDISHAIAVGVRDRGMDKDVERTRVMFKSGTSILLAMSMAEFIDWLNTAYQYEGDRGEVRSPVGRV